MKKKIQEIISNKDFRTAITVPLFFSGIISLLDISLLDGDILWTIDWISFIKTFGLCIYSTVFPNIFIELFLKDATTTKTLHKYLVLLILAVICFLLLGLALLVKINCLIVVSSILSISLLIISSYCFYL